MVFLLLFVVICAISDKFFVKPQDSPSGVSAGQTNPQWLPSKDLGPVIFIDLLNYEFNLVIIPSAPI